MAYFKSYEKPLSAVMQQILKRTSRPNILEYGPGGSTMLMLQVVPEANILCIEHKKKWYDHYKTEFKKYEPNKPDLYQIDLSDNYVTFPKEKFKPRTLELVYVDGRKRVACLNLARDLINKDTGIIVLHDAERPRYRKGHLNWPENRKIWAGKKGNRTLLLVSNEEDYDVLKDFETSPPGKR
jgi:hypothetical protein